MNCIEATRKMVFDITELLQVIDEQAYAQQLEVFNGSTLGQHFRHILDFYRCLHKGITTSQVIDYERRERDVLVEQHPDYAIRAFFDVRNGIEHCNIEESIQVRADFSSRMEDSRPVVQSSIGRELMFAYDHAVHHLAIIKIGLRTAFPHIVIHEQLGVAPSTIKYRSAIEG